MQLCFCAVLQWAFFQPLHSYLNKSQAIVISFKKVGLVKYKFISVDFCYQTRFYFLVDSIVGEMLDPAVLSRVWGLHALSNLDL